MRWEQSYGVPGGTAFVGRPVGGIAGVIGLVVGPTGRPVGERTREFTELVIDVDPGWSALPAVPGITDPVGVGVIAPD